MGIYCEINDSMKGASVEFFTKSQNTDGKSINYLTALDLCPGKMSSLKTFCVHFWDCWG